MEYANSKDGTRIAYWREGDGPPLVLVHGTGIDHSYWDSVSPELARNFTVYSIDRRGRGRSGDTPPYAIQREFEDLEAVIDKVPGQVFLLGHSYGALCSLETALTTRRIRKMILNEPPMYTTVEVTVPDGALEMIRAELEAGEAEKALVTILEAGGMSARELSLMRSRPEWPARVGAAFTIPREFLGVKGYAFEAARFKDLTTPVMLLGGAVTAPVYRAALEALAASLPNCRLVLLPGQGHDAALAAPGPYSREVIGFFLPDQHDGRGPIRPESTTCRAASARSSA